MPQQPKDYVASLTQVGADAPTANVFSNSIGAGNWSRDSLGIFSAYNPGLPFNEAKNFISGFAVHVEGQTDRRVAYYDNSGAVSFFYSFRVVDAGPGTLLQLLVYDNSMNRTDISSVLPNGKFYLPEVRVYP